jgi:hypothetical protein
MNGETSLHDDSLSEDEEAMQWKAKDELSIDSAEEPTW